MSSATADCTSIMSYNQGSNFKGRYHGRRVHDYFPLMAARIGLPMLLPYNMFTISFAKIKTIMLFIAPSALCRCLHLY